MCILYSVQNYVHNIGTNVIHLVGYEKQLLEIFLLFNIGSLLNIIMPINVLVFILYSYKIFWFIYVYKSIVSFFIQLLMNKNTIIL